MTAPTPTTYTPSERADLWTGVIVAAIAAIAVGAIAVTGIAGLFVPGGISVEVPIGGLPAEVPLGPDGAGVDAAVTEARLVVADVDSVSSAAFVSAIVVTALASLLVIAFTLRLTLNLMRGRAFSRENSRLVTGISWAVLLGVTITNIFEVMGCNGLYAQLGGAEFQGQSALFWADWPSYVASIFIGVLAIAFRVGDRLRRDAEGLV